MPPPQSSLPGPSIPSILDQRLWLLSLPLPGCKCRVHSIAVCRGHPPPGQVLVWPLLPAAALAAPGWLLPLTSDHCCRCPHRALGSPGRAAACHPAFETGLRCPTTHCKGVCSSGAASALGTSQRFTAETAADGREGQPWPAAARCFWRSSCWPGPREKEKDLETGSHLTRTPWPWLSTSVVSQSKGHKSIGASSFTEMVSVPSLTRRHVSKLNELSLESR